MEVDSMPRQEIDQQPLNDSQNDPSTTEKKDVTLDLHKYILLLASLVATVTYAAAFSPPGDIWQDTADGHIAGDPILRDTHHKRYVAFFYCNATAFAASLVVIVLVLILGSLEDKHNKDKYYSNSRIDGEYWETSRARIALRTLQAAMVVDLLSLMGAYAAGTCRDTFTNIYSSVLVGLVVLYLVFQMTKVTKVASYIQMKVASYFSNTGSGGVPEGKVEEPHPVPDAPASLATGNPNSSSGGGWPEPEAIQKEDEGQKAKGSLHSMVNKVKANRILSKAVSSMSNEVDKAKSRFRKVLMLLATFAVSITYLAGLSMPGGFWDTAGPGHSPGDAILKDRHNTRLAVFFCFNTLAFVASLLIIVVLLDTKPHDRLRHGFIVVALLSLIGAYNAGSCRQIDTTVYVGSLIAAVVVYILLLLMVARGIDAIWKTQEATGEKKAAEQKPTEEEAVKKARNQEPVQQQATAAAEQPTEEEVAKKAWKQEPVQQQAAAAAAAEQPTEEEAAKKAWKQEPVQQQAAAAAEQPTEKDEAAKKAGKQEPVQQQAAAAVKPTEEEAAKPTEKEEAAKKARSLVLLLATLAATITYQAGLDPPGGVWQDNSGGHTAGDPILLTTNPRRYKAFFYCNSISLVASLVAMAPVKTKLLLKHHVLEAVMILDLFGLIGAYAAGSCRDVNTSIHAMALAGAVLVYVVIHVIFITLDDDTRTRRRSNSDKDSVEKTRKRLLIFAIFAATITYQAGLTPPGGFLQSDGAGHNAGDPVLLHNFPRRYKAFFYCNSVSFMLSIALIILLVNPNVYRPAIRTHALSVCTAAGLFGLMGAYAAGSTQHLKTSVYLFVLVAVVIFFIVLLFLVFWYTGCTKVGEGSNSSTTPRGASHGAGIKTEDKKKRDHAKRKYLMLLGILVASVTYQAGLEPPGGAWQSSSEWYQAGNPVMHDNRRHRYLAFFYSNSTSFMASVVVILLLLVEKLYDNNTWRWRWLVEKLFDDKTWRRRWLLVMNTTIVLDLLGLLGAYAAGSSRRWKGSVNVLLLVIAVLAYMGFHLLLSWSMIRKRSQSAHQV